jgi:hypothetical protein
VVVSSVYADNDGFAVGGPVCNEILILLQREMPWIANTRFAGFEIGNVRCAVLA